MGVGVGGVALEVAQFSGSYKFILLDEGKWNLRNAVRLSQTLGK